MNKENLDKFLLELTELTQRYGMVIAGCGHCGSPTISDIKEDEKSIQSQKYQTIFSMNIQKYL